MTQTEKIKKVTVNLPLHLLEDAQEATGEGLTQTITAGLEKLAASAAYRKLRTLKGSCKLDVDLDTLRLDRDFG